jgi:hypothetical protein
MNALWKLVTSLDFWVGGVIVALIVNVASSYLREAVDRWRESASVKRQAKMAAHKKKVQDYISQMAADQDALDEARQDEMRIRTGLPISVAAAVLVGILVTVAVAISPLTSPSTPPSHKFMEGMAILYTLVLAAGCARRQHAAEVLQAQIALALVQRKVELLEKEKS